MKTINRTVLTIMANQPYIDWANGFDDDGPGMEASEVHATSVLIPDRYDEFNYQDFVRKHYKPIFEAELDAWMADPGVWPKNRTYALFCKWFTVVASDAVIEMGKGPIKIEEF